MSDPKYLRYPATYGTYRDRYSEDLHWRDIEATWLFTSEDGRVSARLYDQHRDKFSYPLPENTRAHPRAYWGPLDESLLLGTWDFGCVDTLEDFLHGECNENGLAFDEEGDDRNGNVPRRFVISDTTGARSYLLASFSAFEMPRVLQALR
jgi:hypothetical protein